MTEGLHDPAVVTWAVPGCIALVLAEIAVIPWRRRGGRDETRAAVASLVMGAGNMVEALRPACVAYGLRLLLCRIPPLDLGAAWWVVALWLMPDDLRYCRAHRIGHRGRCARASHVNHHSSQHCNLTTALRQTWTGTLTGLFVLRAPLVLPAFHPAMIVFVGGLNLLYRFWTQTETVGRFPRWIEAVLNTPSHHRAITAATRAIWTPTARACPSSGTGRSAPMCRSWTASGQTAAWCTTSAPSTRCAWPSTNGRASGAT